jgi:hypothetical protein
VLVVVTYKVALVKRRMPRTVVQEVIEKKVEDSHSFVIPDQKTKNTTWRRTNPTVIARI